MRDLFDILEGKSCKKRRAHPRAPQIPVIDPAELWRSLHSSEAEYIGALAISLSLAAAGTHAHAVLRESCQQMDDFLNWRFPRAYISGNGRIYPRLPILPVSARIAA